MHHPPFTPLLGVDVGGTFTDFVLWDGAALRTHKQLSTPHDQSEAILAGIEALGVGAAEIVHGSTVATNALLEGKGARTGLLTTAGFRDVLVLQRQNRQHLYRLLQPPAAAPGAAGVAMGGARAGGRAGAGDCWVGRGGGGRGGRGDGRGGDRVAGYRLSFFLPQPRARAARRGHRACPPAAPAARPCRATCCRSRASSSARRRASSMPTCAPPSSATCPAWRRGWARGGGCG